MAAEGSLPLALAADLVTASSCLHARSRPELVTELAMKVARLHAQEVPVTELCLPELAPINSQQHPFPKVFHFAESVAMAVGLG